MLIFLSMLESDEERRLFTDLYNQYGNMMLHVAKRYFPKDRRERLSSVKLYHVTFSLKPC